jgi:YggT family protein
VAVIGEILYFLIWIFIGLLLVRLVVEWVQAFARSWAPHGALLVVLEIVYTVTDPPILWVRRFVPPLRLGSIAIDVSFIIVIIVCYVLLAVVRAVFF